MPAIKAAIGSIPKMETRNLERLVALTEIAAPPFMEDARAKDLMQRIRDLGLSDVRIDEVGNVIARRAGTGNGRTVAIAAHIDTVFPPETDVTVRKEGNVYFAPGIGDNTQGLVAMPSLIEMLERHEIQTRSDILFIGSVGEEGLGDLRGVRHLFRDGGPRIDSFIAIDGGSPGRLINEAVGSLRYRVEFKGPGGHSYGAFGRAHPHHALADTISRFTLRAKSIVNDGRKATFSVGRIGGGTSINSIPFVSWMEVDMRSADPAKLDELDSAFKVTISQALDHENENRSRGEGLTVDMKPVGDRPAGKTHAGHPLIRHARSALRAAGIEPQLRASSTDANIPMALGIAAITMSRGGVTRNAHAPDESWENINVAPSIEALFLTILAEAEPQS